MNKLIFKLFYCRMVFLIVFLLFSAVFVGCGQNITGNLAKEIPQEFSRNPDVYFCPKDDCGKLVETHVMSANLSAYCAFYDLNLRNIIDALAKRSKTIDVKLVMENSSYKGQVKGDGVRLDSNAKLMHNKFCIIDKSIVITGSFNPTDNDNNNNNNNVVVIYSSILANNYEDEFNELWNSKSEKSSYVENPAFYINDIKIENYFCPEDCQPGLSSSIDKDNALDKIIDLIRNAEESVKIASFTFTHETIADELIKADARGVNVTILTETRQRNVMGSQYQRVKDFGLDIRLDGNKYNMHHKFIIIDGKVVITGSPNFTLAGFNKNDENMLIIYDRGIALRYAIEFNELYNNGAII